MSVKMTLSVSKMFTAAFKNRSISSSRNVNPFYFLVFLFFLTLSADLWHIELFIFRAKVNHLLALLLFGGYFLIYKQFKIERSLLLVAFLIFLSLALSACLSDFPLRCLGYLGVYLFLFTAYFLLPLNLVLHCDTEKIFRVYYLSFWVIGLYAIGQFLLSLVGVIDPHVRQFVGRLARPHALSYEPSFYALYLTAYVMCANFLFFIQERVRWKGVAKLLLLNLCLCIAFSTGGFLAYFIFLTLTLLLCLSPQIQAYFPKYRKRVAIVFVSFTLLVFGGVLYLERIFQGYFLKIFTEGFYTQDSFTVRWEGIKNGFEVFLSRPFFGVGIGGMGPHLYQQRNPDSTTPALLSLEEIELYDPTNVFTEVLSGMGIFGLACFALLFWVFIQKFRKTLQIPTLSLQERRLAYGFFFSLVVLILELQFNQTLFRTYIWVHAAMIYGYLHKLQPVRKLSSF